MKELTIQLNVWIITLKFQKIHITSICCLLITGTSSCLQVELPAGSNCSQKQLLQVAIVGTAVQVTSTVVATKKCNTNNYRDYRARQNGPMCEVIGQEVEFFKLLTMNYIISER